MSSYMICDEHGNQLCDGVSEERVLQIAREAANRLGASVWYHDTEDRRSRSVRVRPIGKTR
jgi:DUF917 family protein